MKVELDPPAQADQVQGCAPISKGKFTPLNICTKICTLAGSSPLQSLPGHSCPDEKELLSSEDSSTSSNGLLEKVEDDSSSGLDKLDSPVEWNRWRQTSSCRLVCGALEKLSWLMF